MLLSTPPQLGLKGAPLTVQRQFLSQTTWQLEGEAWLLGDSLRPPVVGALLPCAPNEET